LTPEYQLTTAGAIKVLQDFFQDLNIKKSCLTWLIWEVTQLYGQHKMEDEGVEE
jgi:hypothetical protein